MQFTNFYHTVNRHPSRFAGKVSFRHSNGLAQSGGVKQGRGGENKPFCSFKRQYLEHGIGDTSTATINN